MVEIATGLALLVRRTLLSGINVPLLEKSSLCSTQSMVLNAYLNVGSMGRTITGVPRVWTTAMMTLVTRTGTTAVLTRTIPGTTTSMWSPAVGREGVGREPVGREGVGRKAVEREGVGREAVGREGVGREGVGRKGVGREGVGREAVGRKGVGRKGVGREAVGRMGVRREVPASYSISDSDISPDNFIRAYNPYFLCRLLFHNKRLAC